MGCTLCKLFGYLKKKKFEIIKLFISLTLEILNYYNLLGVISLFLKKISVKFIC